MAEKRERRWLAQAEKDLRVAEAQRAQGYFEWACFAAQQSAEKAVKALLLLNRLDPWGHRVVKLLEDLPEAPPKELLHGARVLDLYYISARYPDALPDGTPDEHFDEEQAREAVEHARAIVEWASAQMA